MTTVIVLTTTAVFIPWLSIVYTVIKRGMKAVYSGFFTNDMLLASTDDPLNMGGVSHAIVGTLILVGLAALIAVPLGILSALYIVEIRGRLSGLVRFLIQAMSGVPSIVAGLFVYSTVVLLVFEKFNAISGACALAILMIPTVARTSEEVLRLVPEELRAASYAVGATQLRTTMRVVLPTARGGLVTASVLGVARVAGETAPLLLTSIYFVGFKTSLTDGPIASLPTYVFSSLGIGTENAVARAWGGALVLLSLIFVIFLAARILGGRQKK